MFRCHRLPRHGPSLTIVRATLVRADLPKKGEGTDAHDPNADLLLSMRTARLPHAVPDGLLALYPLT